MIITDLDDQRLENMLNHLIMEGVFNRESKILDICSRMIAFLEKVHDDTWFVRNLAVSLEDHLTHESLSDIAERMGVEITRVEPQSLYNQYGRVADETEDIINELRAEISRLG